MGYKTFYGNVIWTNHAIQRMIQRGLKQDMAWQAFQYPEVSLEGKQPGTIEQQRGFGSHKVTVIAKQNEKGEWVVLSCWVDPPYPTQKGSILQMIIKGLLSFFGL